MESPARPARRSSAALEEVEARSLVDASLAGDVGAFRRLWLEGAELLEIASLLRLRGGADEARRLVRAACATLRRVFVSE